MMTNDMQIKTTKQQLNFIENIKQHTHFGNIYLFRQLKFRHSEPRKVQYRQLEFRHPE